MLCDCLGNMIKIELTNLIKGKRVKTGEIIRVCDRCSFSLSEDEYQQWINQQGKDL